VVALNWRAGAKPLLALPPAHAAFWEEAVDLLFEGALFLWAAAEKLELVPALSAWDMMTILMGFYLVISSVISVRRGLT
jgi:hypothetical protein